MKQILLLLISFPLLAYTPGKWSHLDEYVLKGKKGGPSKEVVKNESGEVIYTAKYTYDASGRLLREEYFGKNGRPDGKSVFRYKDNQVQSEVLYDWNDNVKEKKVFHYNAGKLEKIVLYNDSQNIELVCNVSSIKNGVVNGAETIWKITEDTEKFVIYPDEKNKQIWKQAIFNNQNQKVGEVVYFFNAQGLLKKRTNIQQGNERTNDMEYNRDGKLVQYSFHVKQGEEWKLIKTHYLFYETEGRNIELAN